MRRRAGDGAHVATSPLSVAFSTADTPQLTVRGTGALASASGIDGGDDLAGSEASAGLKIHFAVTSQMSASAVRSSRYSAWPSGAMA